MKVGLSIDNLTFFLCQKCVYPSLKKSPPKAIFPRKLLPNKIPPFDPGQGKPIITPLN